MSIPSSNAVVERVFSQMNLKWTDVRNKCSPDLIKSELIVSVNARSLNCIEFLETLKQHNNRKNILAGVKSSTKYDFINKQ